MGYSVGKFSDYIMFNPKEAIKKGQVAPEIDMASIKPFCKYINAAPYSTYNTGMKFRNGDTLLARITPCLENGKTIFVDNLRNGEVGFGSTEYIVMRAIESKTIPEFVYYIATSSTFREKAISLMTGTSGRQRVQTEALMEENWHFPSIIDQRKIVEILVPLDSKIRQNTRTNDNLFKIAQSIYDEWFAKYNFPGATKGFKDSEIGAIPSEWHVGNIDDKELTRIAKSGVHTYSGTKEYVATADVSGCQITNSQPLLFADRPSRANMQPVASSVWFAKMENSVKNMLVTDYMSDRINGYIFSTGFMGLECLNGSVYYIWCYINSRTFKEVKNNLSTGTLMAGISNSTIRSAQYVIPPKDILKEFNNRVDDLFRTIYNNEQENARLITLRDTLLPELMNGKIDLSKVEI